MYDILKNSKSSKSVRLRYYRVQRLSTLKEILHSFTVETGSCSRYIILNILYNILKLLDDVVFRNPFVLSS